MKKPTEQSKPLGTAARQASERFLSRLQDGSLRPGDRLPPERQLAEQLGVSRLTLGAVLARLEDEGWVRSVSPRIREVAPQAGRLCSRDSQTIAVVGRSMPPEASPEPVPWTPSFHARMLQMIQQQGYNLLMIPQGLQAHEMVSRLVSAGPRGTIMLTTPRQEEVESIATTFRHAGLPLVVYGYLGDDQSRPPVLDTVSSDHTEGARQMTRWLADQGCRHVQLVSFHLSDKPPAWWNARLAGYRRACDELGMDARPPINVSAKIVAQNPRDAFDQKVRAIAGFLYEYLNTEPATDGLSCVSEGLYPVVASACRMLGRKPQQDIRITGYDSHWANGWEIPWEPTRPLALIDKRDEQIARELIDALANPSEEPETHPGRRLVTPRVQPWQDEIIYRE